MTRSRVTPPSRLGARGVTVLEVAVTAALLGLVAAGFGFIVASDVQDPNEESALRDAAHIQRAAADWRSEHPSECPTLSQLIHENHLSQDARKDDPWGTRYRLTCGDESVIVISPGRDGENGTTDDIVYPKADALPRSRGNDA